ncbi:MAG TPA: redox-sensing transcriptional repressor Rex [Candidatus Hydrogenedentes bacterium]|nr:redox-sensing transcriptional repressor Rex [Candidatus Hydrogenedentota bacterium]HRK34293.1 redox-sensing transcriptional repressor Rex [Candidatus Hydrogenedentota bacterium]
MPKNQQPPALNQLIVERLMHYYHLVAEQIETHASGYVSSAQIAELLSMDDTLVRKDLAAIGVRGRPRVGFSTTGLMDAIRETLGFNEHYAAVIVGAGRLGGAIASYAGFGKYGLDVVALFDADHGRVGELLRGIPVEHIDRMEEIIAQRNVRTAVLTVPAEAAQPLADRLVASGVRAIWNFAPTSLVVPAGVFVRHEHISVGLAELAYYLKCNDLAGGHV